MLVNLNTVFCVSLSLNVPKLCEAFSNFISACANALMQLKESSAMNVEKNLFIVRCMIVLLLANVRFNP